MENIDRKNRLKNKNFGLLGIGTIVTIVTIFAILITAPVISEASTSVVVTANPLWTDTGITVNTSNTVNITSSGLWNSGAGPIGPNGGDTTCCDWDLFLANPPALHSELIAFVGSDPYQGHWGDGTFFPQTAGKGYWGIGSSGSFVSDRNGELWLGINDDAVSKYTVDNSGSVTAVIVIRTKGIDVSHHQNDQGNIDWNDVHNAGKKFAFVKSTQGKNYADPYFKENMDDAAAAGLLVGAYHFAEPYNYTPKQEAKNFIKVAGDYLKIGYLRPALDIENLDSCTLKVKGAKNVSDWINKWMAIVMDDTHVRPIIYTTLYDQGCLDSSITRYDLWIAQYPKNPDNQNPHTGIWTNWAFWQYSETGAVDGISGNVDLDVFNGDESELNNFIIK